MSGYAVGLTMAMRVVDSLEDCGVQLEAVYLEDGQPVTGGYNGMRLFVDDQGIDAAQFDRQANVDILEEIKTAGLNGHGSNILLIRRLG